MAKSKSLNGSTLELLPLIATLLKEAQDVLDFLH